MQAVFSHLVMKLVLAAPASFLSIDWVMQASSAKASGGCLRSFVAPGELGAGERRAFHRGDDCCEIGRRIEMDEPRQREHLEDVAMGTVAGDRPWTLIADPPE